MDKEDFFKTITQQDQWAVCDLIHVLDMTEDELATLILVYKDELEVHVEGEYTTSGAGISKSIGFKIRESGHHELFTDVDTCYFFLKKEDTPKTITKSIIKCLENLSFHQIPFQRHAEFLPRHNRCIIPPYDL